MQRFVGAATDAAESRPAPGRKAHNAKTRRGPGNGRPARAGPAASTYYTLPSRARAAATAAERRAAAADEGADPTVKNGLAGRPERTPSLRTSMSKTHLKFN